MRTENKIIKKYYGCLLGAMVMLLGLFSGCEEDSDRNLPLAVNSNLVKLPATGGATHIMVYSTGEWHAEFEPPVSWASLNKLDEKGNSSVYLSYAQNFGAARKLTILLTMDSETKRVSIVQEGITPTLVFPTTKYTIPKTASPISFPLTTNLKHNLKDIEVYVQYDDETSEQWVSDVKITSDAFEFYALENNLGETRSARINLIFTDGLDVAYSTFVDVTQNAILYTTYTHSQLRALISGAGGEVEITDAAACLTGIVISDAQNPNMETNPNTAYNKMDFTENAKTAYIQDIDGSMGIRIKTLTAADNRFTRYSKVTLSLAGTTLVKEANPERYTLKNVSVINVMEALPGDAGNVATKEKYIKDLVDADVYTYITLKDVEFALPYGTYMNINTGYTVKTDWNTGGITNGAYLDAVPTAIRDNKGGSMYLLLNGSVPWYKKPRPVGSGIISGIIVNTKLLRFGAGDGDIGPYSIRVLNEQSIALSNPPKATTIVEWNWIKNGTDVSAAGSISKDAEQNVMPAIGTGKMYCTAGTTCGLGAQHIYFADAASKGAVNSALHYTAKWWNTTSNTGEAFVFNFSTAGISGNNFTINFSQGGGSGSAATIGIPTYWQVEYSTDGTNYTVLPNSTYCVRPLGWWNGQLSYVLFGLIDYSFALPSSLLGQSSVFVKLKAQSNICATETGAENGTITASNAAVNVRVGFVSFKYNN